LTQKQRFSVFFPNLESPESPESMKAENLFILGESAGCALLAPWCMCG